MDQTDAKHYWEDRLHASLNLRGTGHRAFDLSYNRWLYQAQADCVDMLLQHNGISVDGLRVLDVGSGSGFWVDHYLQKGVRSICGLDIAQSSVAHLRASYPEGRFAVCDISSGQAPFSEPFDLVSAIGVLYHIIDDAGFDRALRTLCSLTRPGGYLLLSDMFCKPLLPTARHARMRTMQAYEDVLAVCGIRCVQKTPMYYALNRVFIPVVGPAIISATRAAYWLYRLDRRLRERGLANGRGMKLLLACRETT